jgi:hypothetical protein
MVVKRTSLVALGTMIAIALAAGAWWLLDASRDDARRGDELAIAPNGSATRPHESSERDDARRAIDLGALTAASSDDRTPVASSAPAAPAKIRLRGTVRDMEDSTIAVRGAKVTVASAWKEIEARTDYNGVFVVDGLGPGAWRVSVESSGFRPWTTECNLDAEPPAQSIEVQLKRQGVLAIALQTPDGADLFAALHDEMPKLQITILATHEPPDDALLVNRDAACRVSGEIRDTNAAHRSELNAPVRLFQTNEPPPLYVSACFGDHIVQTQFVPKDAELVTLVISPDALREASHGMTLRVVDAESGAPLAGASIDVRCPPPFFSDESTMTDTNGIASLSRRIPGRATISIQALGYETYEKLVSLRNDTDTDLGTYRLTRGVSVEVTVTDEHDRPVELGMYELRVDRLDQGSPSKVPLWSFHIDSLRRVKLSSLGRHKYVVRVCNSRLCASPTLLDLTEDGAREITIHCTRPVHTRLRVDLATADEVDIVDENRLPVVESALSDVGFMDLASPPGAYTATLVKAGRVVRTTRFEVVTHDSEIDLLR